MIALLERDAFRSVPGRSDAVNAAAVRLAAFGSLSILQSCLLRIPSGVPFRRGFKVSDS
jgi:hypothetical protein